MTNSFRIRCLCLDETRSSIRVASIWAPIIRAMRGAFIIRSNSCPVIGWEHPLRMLMAIWWRRQTKWIKWMKMQRPKGQIALSHSIMITLISIRRLVRFKIQIYLRFQYNKICNSCRTWRTIMIKICAKHQRWKSKTDPKWGPRYVSLAQDRTNTPSHWLP